MRKHIILTLIVSLITTASICGCSSNDTSKNEVDKQIISNSSNNTKKVNYGEFLDESKDKNQDKSVDSNSIRTNKDKIRVDLNWETEEDDSGVDLDLSAFILNSDGRIDEDREDRFIFYSNTVDNDKYIEYKEDERNSKFAFNYEQLNINLSNINNNDEIQKIAIVVTIYNKENNNFTFNDADSASLVFSDTLYNANSEIAYYNLKNYDKNTKSFIVELCKDKNGYWIINELKDHRIDDLLDICSMYGLGAEYK